MTELLFSEQVSGRRIIGRAAAPLAGGQRGDPQGGAEKSKVHKVPQLLGAAQTEKAEKGRLEQAEHTQQSPPVPPQKRDPTPQADGGRGGDRERHLRGHQYNQCAKGAQHPVHQTQSAPPLPAFLDDPIGVLRKRAEPVRQGPELGVFSSGGQLSQLFQSEAHLGNQSILVQRGGGNGNYVLQGEPSS